MRNALAIANKELKTYFSSPMAYVIAAVFLAISGFFFVQDLTGTQLARLVGFFGPAGFLLLLIAPVLTMRLLAEEQKLGTLELLLTAPVRDGEVVLGKFLGAVGILFGMLLLTLYFPLVLLFFAQPDFGPIVSGYLGLLLLGMAFMSVGLLASSMSSNQIVAAVLAIGVLLIFWLIGAAGNLVQNYPVAKAIVTYLSMGDHYNEFLRGVIDTKDIVYFVTFTGAALFLATRSLETRRWR